MIGHTPDRRAGNRSNGVTCSNAKSTGTYDRPAPVRASAPAARTADAGQVEAQWIVIVTWLESTEVGEVSGLLTVK
jgi:hypothetical protein